MLIIILYTVVMDTNQSLYPGIYYKTWQIKWITLIILIDACRLHSLVS